MPLDGASTRLDGAQIPEGDGVSSWERCGVARADAAGEFSDSARQVPGVTQCTCCFVREAGFTEEEDPVWPFVAAPGRGQVVFGSEQGCDCRLPLPRRAGWRSMQLEARDVRGVRTRAFAMLVGSGVLTSTGGRTVRSGAWDPHTVVRRHHRAGGRDHRCPIGVLSASGPISATGGAAR